MNFGLAAVNHLLGQHPVLRAELAAFAGRRVALTLAPLSVTGVITDDGWFADCAGEAEAGIRLGAAAAVSALRGRSPDFGAVDVSGDVELAHGVGRVLSQLRWHAGEDAARLVGDIAANRLERSVRRLGGIQGEIGWRLAQNWIEHVRDEEPLLAHRDEVARFVGAVDTLRDDCERLEKRLDVLSQNLRGRSEAGVK
ncbi:ubiquinone biosynthesis accessory factor UbiJ [Paludibacterium yongneupense]|uniref:ubiquinone biosynthesis accessory factor UbiJ n=1 Tax=Paludibacterium yongneupense TaxID=400061 RepID=UPI00040BA15B|nr:sterol-binding protein [Paludibacterium yongneupense]